MLNYGILSSFTSISLLDNLLVYSCQVFLLFFLLSYFVVLQLVISWKKLANSPTLFPVPESSESHPGLSLCRVPEESQAEFIAVARVSYNDLINTWFNIINYLLDIFSSYWILTLDI